MYSQLGRYGFAIAARPFCILILLSCYHKRNVVSIAFLSRCTDLLCSSVFVRSVKKVRRRTNSYGGYYLVCVGSDDICGKVYYHSYGQHKLYPAVFYAVPCKDRKCDMTARTHKLPCTAEECIGCGHVKSDSGNTCPKIFKRTMTDTVRNSVGSVPVLFKDIVKCDDPCRFFKDR